MSSTSGSYFGTMKRPLSNYRCLPFVLFMLTHILCYLFAAETSQNAKLDIPYKTTPEGAFALDLYYPTVKADKKYPVVIYTHGGGWAAGSKKGATSASMSKVVSGLTKNGFCVASVDYRLYVKDGQITIKDCVTDCKDAIRYLAKHGEELNVDTTRVFTWGDSAGGQIAQMLLLAPSNVFPGASELADATYKTIAGVSWYGPCDFEKTELFNPDGRADFRDRFGPRILKPDSDPKDALRLYREMSPVNYLKAESPPLLMIQGDKDTTIPVHHAHYMKERAEAVHSPVEILIVKNAGHNWRKVDADIQPSLETIIEKTVSFLKQHLDQSGNK